MEVKKHTYTPLKHTLFSKKRRLRRAYNVLIRRIATKLSFSHRHKIRRALLLTISLFILGGASFWAWKTFAATSTSVITTSSVNSATQNSTQKNIVRTSDGTLHAFVQVGTEVSTCNGVSSSGLLWFMSTNGGSSWTCQGQLHSDTTNQEAASATVDSSDNIYVVYSRSSLGQSGWDVHYRKFTKGSGASWSMGSQQTAIASSSTTGNNLAVVTVEGTTRLWVATRFTSSFGFSNIAVYYSSDLTDSPTWSISKQTLGSASAANSRHLPTIARFGSKIGIFSKSDIAGAGIEWSIHADSDDLTNWTTPVQVLTSGNQDGAFFSAVGDPNGNVFLTSNDSANNIRFTYFNGTLWSPLVNLGTSAPAGAFSSVSTDGHNVWVIYPDSTGLSSSLPGARKLGYKKGVPPYTSGSFDSSSTSIVDYHGTFDKYWSFVSSAYTDDTTDAASTTGSDTQMATGIGDIVYFGKTAKFDTVAWGLTNNGVGGVVTWEYWNGSTWTALTFTSSQNTNFTAAGYGSFSDPADWAQTSVNGEGATYYYVRARVTTGFTRAPTGAQMSDIPLINWASFVQNPASNTLYGMWTENTATPFKVRSGTATVTTATPNTASTASLVPYTAAYSDVATSTYPTGSRRIVRTSDGTIHMFITAGTVTNACGGSSNANSSVGLNWVYSTDFGLNWTCGGQLSSDTTNIMRASVITDSSDNIYVAYGTTSNVGSASNDIFYRKLTKGVGDNWTIGAAQTVLDSASSSEGYTFPALETDGTHIWLFARRFVASNQFQIAVYYSDGFSDAPTWTLSTNSLDSAGNSSSSGDAVATVRFGTKIGAIWRTSASARIDWRFRNDSDGLTTWSSQTVAASDNTNFDSLSAAADSSGNVILAHLVTTNMQVSVYNGTSWGGAFNISTTAAGNPYVMSDGTSVWVAYLDTNGLNAGLTGNRRLVYKKGVAPFDSGNFDTNPTQFVSYHGTFDKYWSFVSSAYVDDTTDAGDTDGTNTSSSGTGNDVQMATGIGDIVYFGKTEKFDGVEYDLATAGSGGTVLWEYWNGSSWVPITDFLRVVNEHLTGDGYITFIPNIDWATTSVNGEGSAYYYVRARVTTAFSISPVAAQLASVPGLIADPNFLYSPMAGNRLVGMYNDGGGAAYRIRFIAGAADTTAPITNASAIAMKRTVAGTSVSSNAWTNNSAPYFSWTAGADDTNGSGLRGYCAYLGTDSSADPATSKGLLGISPGSTSGTTCQFIIPTTSIDFATTAYRGASWLTTSSSPYYLSLKAVDSAGNIFGSSVQFQFRFDNTPPTNVNFTSCASGSFANVADMSFSWPTSGSPAATDSTAGILGWQYQLNSASGTWLGKTSESILGVGNYITTADSSYTLTSAQDASSVVTGNNVVYFRTVDAAGNTSIDSTIRTCNISFGGDAPSFGGTDIVTVTPSSATSNSYALSWPSASPASGQTVTHYYYMVNTSPPATLATLQANAATYIDNGTSTSVATGALSGVNKGSNTVYVVAVDNSSNYSPSNAISGTFTLNSTDPDNAGNVVGSDSSIKSQSRWNVTLTWTAPSYVGAGNITYLIYRSSDGSSFAQVGSTTGLSYVDTAPTSSLFYYKIISRDGAGGLSSGTNAVSITPTGRFTSPPSLTDGPSVSSITTKKAVIVWSTSRTSDSKVAYGTSPGSYNTEEPSNSSQVSAHTITLSGLLPGTTYYYKAKWTDEDGNSDSSSEKTFTTASAPSLKDVSVKGIGLSSAVVQFTSKDASKAKIYYGTSTDFGGAKEIATSTTETSYAIELNGLSDGTKYYYKINTFDSDGNEYSNQTNDFTTLPRPRISNVKIQQVANTAQSTLLVTWTTNTEVSSIVTFYPQGNIDQARDEVNVALTKGQHKMIIRSLLPRVNYIMVVKGRDKVGNEAVSDSQQVTTATDTRPPLISALHVEGSNNPPVSASGQETTTQLLVSWNTDEPATSQVEFGEGTGTSYNQKTQEDSNLTSNHLVIISGLSPSKVYHLRTVSKDKAQNVGSSVDTVTITPKSTDNALNLVITNLQQAFGFLGAIKR